MTLRAIFVALVFMVCLVAIGQAPWLSGPRRPVAAVADPALSINNGRPCYNVLDFGADPTGITASGAALAAALEAAESSNQVGVAVCVPAGTYTLAGDVTLLLPEPYQNAITILGDGPSATVFVETTPGANVFDSCPGFNNVTPGMAIPIACQPHLSSSPTPCPPTGCDPASPSPFPGNVNGAVFSNFTITYLTPAGPPMVAPTFAPAGWGPSAFAFPLANGLLFDNVVINNAYNCYDLGEETSNAVTNVVIRDAAGLNTCTGHFFGFQGGAGQLTVSHMHISGGRGAPTPGPIFQGIAFDYSNVGENGNLTVHTWDGNTFEQGAWGVFALIDGDTLGDTRWQGNSCILATFACYYIGPIPNALSNPGNTSHLTITDKSDTSWYSSVIIDGGYYSGAGGIEGIQINGPGTYAGSQSPGKGASYAIIAGTPDPGGFNADGSSVSVVFPAHGLNTPFTYTYKAIAGDNDRTIASAVAAAIGAPLETQSPGPLSPPARIGTTQLASASYGLLELVNWTPPPTGNPSPLAFAIITSGSLRVAELQSPYPRCTLPAAAAWPGHENTPAPCLSALIDMGDGVALKNSAKDVGIQGAQLLSPLGAALHLWNGTGDRIRAIGNTMGRSLLSTSFVGLQIDPTPIANFLVASNDLTGAATPMAVAPIPTPTPGIFPVIRGNRGVSLAPTSTAATTSNYVYTNWGPFDCMLYFHYMPSGTIVPQFGLQLPGSASPVSLPTPLYQVWMPVGSILTVTPNTISVYQTMFCTP